MGKYKLLDFFVKRITDSFIIYAPNNIYTLIVYFKTNDMVKFNVYDKKFVYYHALFLIYCGKNKR